MEMDKSAIQQFIEANVPVLKEIGFEVVSTEGGRTTTHVPFNKKNGNHAGCMYAGVLFSQAEATAGVAVSLLFNPLSYLIVIKEMSIRYLKMAKGDVEASAGFSTDEVEAVRAALGEKGKAVQPIVVTMTCGGEPVAEATAEVYVRPHGA
jgi:acyl-coenzyme A thioesterase PaaI-like protein